MSVERCCFLCKAVVPQNALLRNLYIFPFIVTQELQKATKISFWKI